MNEPTLTTWPSLPLFSPAPLGGVCDGSYAAASSSRSPLPDGVSADALLPVAEAHGVVFLPGTRCGYEAQFGGHARLCFAMEERDLLVEGAKRLGAATRELLAAK